MKKFLTIAIVVVLVLLAGKLLFGAEPQVKAFNGDTVEAPQQAETLRRNMPDKMPEGKGLKKFKELPAKAFRASAFVWGLAVELVKILVVSVIMLFIVHFVRRSKATKDDSDVDVVDNFVAAFDRTVSTAQKMRDKRQKEVAKIEKRLSKLHNKVTKRVR